jgi:hypothetical protein
MATLRDLERCTYLPLDCDMLLAVGWLGKDADFEKGTVAQDFYQKLKKLCANPWQPVATAGVHECELCQFDPPHFSANVFVPYKGKIYAAPVGIVHYVAAHRYRPPQVFVEAVLACPLIDTMDYKKAILANGGRSLVGRSSA